MRISDWSSDLCSSDLHPLDPLTSSEIALFREILVEAGLVKESSRLGYVLLKEPEKSKVWAFKPGDDFEREITAVIYDTAANVLERVLVNMTTKKILELEEIDQTVHGTTPFLEQELFSPIELIMEDDDRKSVT